MMAESNGNTARFFVGNRSDFSECDRKVFQVGDSEIGVFEHDGDFFAYENYCPHMGGPVCQGKIVSKVTEVIDENKQSRGLQYDGINRHVVCPWHGYEYDVRTGIHAGTAKIRLRRYEVEVTANGDIYVLGG